MKHYRYFSVTLFALVAIGIMFGPSCSKQDDQTDRSDEPEFSLFQTQSKPLPVATIILSQQPFAIELAYTAASRTRGLMFRKELAENAGMLFVFARSAPRSFYMKNCLIDLDIIFIAADGKIVQANTMRAPSPGKPLKTYVCSKPVKYVLELPAGTIAGLSLLPGTTIDLPRRIRTIIPQPD